MKPPFYIPALMLILLQSCVTSKTSFDQSNIKGLARETEVVKQLAEKAVYLAYTRKTSLTFNTNSLPTSDRIAFNKLGTGYDVVVNFGEPLSGTPDSVVVFKIYFSLLYGKGELVYDFGANTRSFNNDTTNKNDHVFIKVADRLYYYRYSIPMM